MIGLGGELVSCSFIYFLPAGSKSPAFSGGFQVPMQGAGDGDGSRRGESNAPAGSLNEQIVVALARLQDDMQSVLERLHTLEALTASQVRLGVVRILVHRQKLFFFFSN